MLLRLLPIALLALTLFAAPHATADPLCVGAGSGGSCIGAYASCNPLDNFCSITRGYICVGSYDGSDCTGVQKP